MEKLANYIRFYNVIEKEHALFFDCAVNLDDYSVEKNIFIKFPDEIEVEDDSDIIATALATLAGQGVFQFVKIELNVSEFVMESISKYTKATVICSKTKAIDYRTANNANCIAISFSGGMDSLAASAILPSDSKLIALDFGPTFNRERSFYELFSPYILKTNLRTQIPFETWTHEYMGIGIILLSKKLGLKYHVFGTIMESGFWNLDHIEYLSRHTEVKPFTTLGMKSLSAVNGITEIGTTMVCMHYYPQLLLDSLKSLANEGTEKKVRKEVLARIIALKYGYDIDVPVSEAYEKKKFGEYILCDFLSIWIVKNGGIELAERFVTDIPDEFISLANDLKCDFYERLHVDFIDNQTLPNKEVLEYYLDRLAQAGVIPYNENDIYEFNLILEKLKEFHEKKKTHTSESEKMNVISEEGELREILRNEEEIYLYGTGKNCYALLTYMAQIGLPLDRIQAILVTSKNYNPESVMGIPVISIGSLFVMTKHKILVTALEKNHLTIYESLKNERYLSDDILFITNKLSKTIRRIVKDLDVDILNNSQWIRDDLVRIENRQKLLFRDLSTNVIECKGYIRACHASIEYLEKELAKIRSCIQNNTQSYEECIPERLYEDYLRNLYQERFDTFPNLDNPRTFTEKIQWIKLNGLQPLHTLLSDKYAVRDWVSEKIGEKYLIPLLGRWNSFDDIDFSILPKKFVLKCTHGSGYNYVIKDKDIINKYWLSRKFNKWMETNFAYHIGLELQYKDIMPQIIAEEYLENGDGDLNDYKFWCFNGHCEFIMFLSERSTSLKMDNFDRNWNHLPFTYDYPNCGKEIKKPDKLAEMIDVAERLSEGFPFVRVDLYQLDDGTVKFGEMTFTPASGLAKWSDDEIDLKLGKLIRLPMEE